MKVECISLQIGIAPTLPPDARLALVARRRAR